MKKIEKIVLCYFFEKLNYNPKDKLKELSDEIKSLFDDSFMFNNEDATHLYSMPRIESLSKDKKMLFQMSLINMTIGFNPGELEPDEIILWINNHLQFFFDVLKNVFDVKILYSSVKMILHEEKKNPANSLAKEFQIKDKLENLSINRGYTISNNYYVNILLNSNKEYNFNFERNENMKEQDLFDMTMITSLSKSSLAKEFITEILEINDRLAFNKNSDYESSKESIRGMIIELKKIMKEENIQ